MRLSTQGPIDFRELNVCSSPGGEANLLPWCQWMDPAKKSTVVVASCVWPLVLGIACKSYCSISLRVYVIMNRASGEAASLVFPLFPEGKKKLHMIYEPLFRSGAYGAPKT